ncbi:hypothetical protein [Streptomyces sp. NPDC059272]|uniref:hypothetical protein n=1 Tax=Streptomyces sp. NPDC059272 TaxID=3346800 RepID=UPI0036A30EC5
MAGRPMNPIPEDADPVLRAFVTELREFVDTAVEPGQAVSSLARASSSPKIGRSTLMHALGGQRLPTLTTVQTIVDIVVRSHELPDVKRRELFGEWTLKWKRAMTLLGPAGTATRIAGDTSSGKSFESRGIISGSSNTIVHNAIGSNPAYVEEPSSVRREARGEDSALRLEVSVAEASARLTRALDGLERAAAEVARAREELRQAQEQEHRRGSAADGHAHARRKRSLEQQDRELRETVRYSEQFVMRLMMLYSMQRQVTDPTSERAELSPGQPQNSVQVLMMLLNIIKSLERRIAALDPQRDALRARESVKYGNTDAL